MQKIPLYSKSGIACFTTVDDADFEFLKKFRWFKSAQGYAVSHMDNWETTYLLHRILLTPTGKNEIDHINGDRLDNTRSNLRIASRLQNGKNLSPRKNKKHSSFKGVTKLDGKWMSQICSTTFSEGRSKYLGCFSTETEAALAYDEAAKRLFGEYAKTNFAHV